LADNVCESTDAATPMLCCRQKVHGYKPNKRMATLSYALLYVSSNVDDIRIEHLDTSLLIQANNDACFRTVDKHCKDKYLKILMPQIRKS